MSNGLLQKLIDEDFGIEGRGKWLHSVDHDSLVINSENETWFWNKTGQRGNVFDYLIQIRGMKKDQARNFLKNSFGGFSEIKESIEPQQAYEKLVNVMWENGKTNREYWYKRCLSDDTIDRYKLGYFQGWNLIPIHLNGEFINFQIRRDEPEKRITNWYKHIADKPLFGSEILQFTKIVYITEGLVDSILLRQEGFPAVASYGVNYWKPEWFGLFSNMNEIYYLEDNDIAGRVGARTVAKALGLGRVKIVSFPEQREKNDTGDFFKDGGTKETFVEHVKNNSHYLFELEGVVNDWTISKHKRNKGFTKS